MPFVLGGCFVEGLSVGGLSGCSAEYTITYVLNADDAVFEENEENPTVYYSDEAKYLYSPKREGYVFRGWYAEEDFSGWVWNNIPKGTTGNLTLYAKWGREGEAVYWEGFVPYLEKFDNASGTMSVNSRDELAAYLEYIQYYYVIKNENDVRIRLNYDYKSDNPNATPRDEINDVFETLSFSSYVGVSYDLVSAPRLGVAYTSLIGTEASKQSTNRDNFTQISPYLYEEEGAPHEFAIDGTETTLECTTSNQLFYAAQVGVRPVPTEGSDAERMYEAARQTLAQVVADGMTDVEKVVAIFEWLVMNVTYDQDVLQYSQDIEKAAQYDAFYLEGVFDSGRAVCDGISKAMTLMCRIEGIPCVRVTGAGHAWNKVFLDGSWYIADATFGDTIIALGRTEYSFMNREYLLTSESAAEEYGMGDNYNDDIYEASVDYGYYDKTTFVYDNETYDFVINSREEYSALYNWARDLNETFDGAIYSVDFYIDNVNWVSRGNVRAVDGNYVTIFFNA